MTEAAPTTLPELRTAARRTLLALSVLLLFGAFAFEGQAHAGQILAESGVFVGDPSASYSMSVSSAGTLSVNLMDYAWPSPLADLTLEIASPTQILGQMTGPGQQTFSLTGPGTYYAFVIGVAQGPLDIGAYGVTANFQALGAPTPVPLPASVSLLLGGIAATLWSVRRKPRIAPRIRQPRTGADLGLAGASG